MYDEVDTINLSQNTPSCFDHSHPNILATFWSSSGSLLLGVCLAVLSMAALMSRIDSEYLLLMVIWTLEKSWTSHKARSGE